MALLLTLLSAAPAAGVIGFGLTCELQSDSCLNCPAGPGSDNGALDPGERIFLTWTFENVGDEDATGIVALADSAASDLFCQPNLVDVGDLAAGAVSGPLDSPRCTIDETTACGTALDLQVTLNTDQGVFPALCTVDVPAFCDTCCGTGLPVLESCAVMGDTCDTGGAGSGDGGLDPGERAQVEVTLTNQGSQRTRPVRALVSSPTPGVRVPVGETLYGEILHPDSQVGAPPVEVFPDAFVPPGSALTLSVVIQEEDMAGAWQTVGEDQCTVAVADPAVACLPATPPEPVPFLQVRRSGPDLVLEWQEASEATRYALHEGTLASPPAPPWNHQARPDDCLLPPPPATTLSGSARDGRDLYFLVQARNGLADSGVGQVDLDGDGTPETARPADLSICN